jgi:hypothetical protein
MGHRATAGPAFLPCRARAVPRAKVAAQARPGGSGRAGTGTVPPGRAVPRAGPKSRAAGYMANYNYS